MALDRRSNRTRLLRNAGAAAFSAVLAMAMPQAAAHTQPAQNAPPTTAQPTGQTAGQDRWRYVKENTNGWLARAEGSRLRGNCEQRREELGRVRDTLDYWIRQRVWSQDPMPEEMRTEWEGRLQAALQRPCPPPTTTPPPEPQGGGQTGQQPPPTTAHPIGGTVPVDRFWPAKQDINMFLEMAEVERLSGNCKVRLRKLGEVRRRLDDYIRSRGWSPQPPEELRAEWERRLQEALQRPCPPPATTPPREPQGDGQTGQQPTEGVLHLDRTSEQLLALHNRARAEVGSPPLKWDPQLAAQAASYGPRLAQYGRPVHSSRVGRETSRENLLQALPGTPVDRMVGVWIAERQHFVPGTFPNVSRTGNWADVGHYTQMIWPTTTRIGCAVHRGGGRFDWLICRYSPPGNADGKPLLMPAPPRAR